MASFDRGEFSKLSKEELLDYIEQQCEQLVRFEGRFRDVVRAYKGILKEKEALEATLHVLSSQQPSEGTDEEGGLEDEGEEESRQSDRVEEEGEEDKDTSVAESKAESAAAKGKDHQQLSSLRHQLATLTTALATLTEEKSKMEGSFQQDKRSVLAQQDALTRQLQEEREQWEEERDELCGRIQEVQQYLKAEQRSRDEDQRDQADMLKELQTLIASERSQKEAFNIQLQEAERELLRLQNMIAEDRTHEYEERVRQLSRELDEVRTRLNAAERHSLEPSPLLLQLQSELTAVKEEHAKAVLKEQQRANEAEARLKAQAQHEETRVASLESKLSELSATVGNYDRQREQDQMAIQKLKERIAQLDSENTALTKAHIDRPVSVDNETPAQISALQEKVARLKAFLKIAMVKINEKAYLPSNVEELSVSDYSELLASEQSRKDYQQELYQLKDEFERYKTRAQSVLKNRGNKELDVASKELKDLQRRNNELQSMVDSLQAQCEEEEERGQFQAQKLREEMREMYDHHREEMAALESQHKQKLSDLQQRTQTTRDRSLKLLSEKEAEIQHLRSELQVLDSLPGSQRSFRRTVSATSVSSQHSQLSENGKESGSQVNLAGEPSDTTTTVQELLEHPSPTTPGQNRQLFHFVQEQHRRENDIAIARRRIVELEDTLRDVQEREQRHMEQTVLLKQEIRKLGRDRSRETENLEYLKNVVIHYMCADSTGREQMVTPLATILHFSPDEVQLIKRTMAAKRWLPRTN